MKVLCRYLDGESFGRCLVDKDRYIPRIFETEEYRKEICAKDKHAICPWYRRHSGVTAAEKYVLNGTLSVVGKELSL
jgi:hypothetical protein